MPVVTEPTIFLKASVGTIASIMISMVWIARKIKKLDLVEVLKERE
jgi:ABC-type antimicrobial peptide transport system permease subunit